MIKINNNINNSTSISNDNGQTIKSQSYLLGQPISDTLSFEGKDDKIDQDKKPSALKKWGIGILATAGTILVAVAIGKKIHTQEVEDLFTNIVKNKSLEELKRDISKDLGDAANFDKPSEMVSRQVKSGFLNNYAKNKILNLNLYAFMKKQQDVITDPTEKEKCKQLGLFLINQMHSDYKICNHKALGVVEKELYEAVDDILNYHLKEINLEEKAPADAIGKQQVSEISDKTKNQIKENMKRLRYSPNSHEMFSNILGNLSEDYLKEIEQKHIKNDSITDEGKKLLADAEILNKIALKIQDRMNISKSSFWRSIYENSKITIKNYQQGKFVTGQQQFWEEYFNRTYSSYENYNSGTTIKKQDILVESSNIFKQYGEDLGDLNSLTKDKLRKAYHNLAIKYHPDRHPEDKPKAEEIFKAINNANKALSDSVKNN